MYINTLNPQLRNLNTDFTLGTCLYRSVRITMNADPFILSFMQRFENGYHFEAIRFSAHPQRSMRLSM